ncbi:unnamed protein product [Prorocentrum cordatum]|uniref:Uncharacterized protein n=1 Tax=Prorocentrum cordatum TaxID=2364126 RepID=A0ABN9SSH7_9DINO|nr:unnamed protein product [Polarella glacialis]
MLARSSRSGGLSARVFFSEKLLSPRPRRMQAAAGWGLGALGERFWNNGSQDLSCHCDFSGPEPGAGVLEVLREQLARCGPEHLQGVTHPACPSCSCLACLEVASLQRDILLAGLGSCAGLVAGVLAVCIWWTSGSMAPRTLRAALAEGTEEQEQLVRRTGPPLRARLPLTAQGRGEVRDGFTSW